MDYSLPGCSVQGIVQARILEWIAISFSRGSSWSRDWAQIYYGSCNFRWILYHCPTCNLILNILTRINCFFFLLWECCTYLYLCTQLLVPPIGHDREEKFSSVQFICLVMSTSLRPHGLQHARPPCPSPTPRVYSNSCPLSWWCHPTISSSGHPLLLLPSVFLSIRVFSNESALRMRWPKNWSFSFNISPSNEHSGLVSFRMDWLISLQSKGLSRVFSNTTVQKHQFFWSIHDYWKNHSLD